VISEIVGTGFLLVALIALVFMINIGRSVYNNKSRSRIINGIVFMVMEFVIAIYSIVMSCIYFGFIK
jgi:hypothetical protein